MEIGSRMKYIGKLYAEHYGQLCTILECTKRGLCTVRFDNCDSDMLVMNFTLVKPEEVEGG